MLIPAVTRGSVQQLGLAVGDPLGVAVGLVLAVGAAHAAINRPIPSVTASAYRPLLFVIMRLLMRVALSATLAFTGILAGFVPSSVALAAAGVWLATRVAYVIYTYVVLAFGNTTAPRAQAFLQSWNQFDTRWFLLISQVGYSTPVSSAFFPLYPTLIGLVTAALGDAQGPVSPAFDGVRLLVAFGIANAATLLAFIGLALLAAHEYREEAVARAAVWVLASYPFAFFLAAPYSDGPFLAAAVFVLYFARRGSWKWAALAAFLAGLTRPTAVTLVLPLAWEFGRQHGWWSSAVLRDWRGHLKDLPGGLLVVAAAPLALALYGVFLWQRFGTPLVWFNVQGSYWHRAAIPHWRIAGGLVRRMLTFQPLEAAEAHLLLNVVPLAICLIVVAVSIRRPTPDRSSVSNGFRVRTPCSR